jgi:enoyl-CoA hydratase/carnithine racemase
MPELFDLEFETAPLGDVRRHQERAWARQWDYVRAASAQGVGYQQAMELMLLGERKSAADLKQQGLINRVVPADALLPTALALAEQVAGKSATSVAALKNLLNGHLSAIETALQLEEVETIRAFQRPESALRVQAFTSRPKAASPKGAPR